MRKQWHNIILQPLLKKKCIAKQWLWVVSEEPGETSEWEDLAHNTWIHWSAYSHFYLTNEVEILRKPLQSYFTSSCDNPNDVPILHPPSFLLTPGLPGSPAPMRACPSSVSFPVLFHPQPLKASVPGTHCSIFFINILSPRQSRAITKPLFHCLFIHSTNTC